MVTLLGLAAAFCYALGAALQHVVAVDRTEQGTTFLAALFRRPVWLLGNVANALGWGLQFAALGRGELIYVQPLLLASVILSLLLTALIRHDRPGAREWIGGLLLIVGVVSFLFGTRPLQPAAPTSGAWPLTVVALGVVSAMFVLAGRYNASRRATLYAIAAGLLFGLAAALTKATAATGLQILVHWPVYALIPVTAAAFYWMQRAYQSGPLAASFPVIIALDPIVSAVLGILLFGERVATDPASLALAIAGALVTLLGIATLATSRLAAPDPALTGPTVHLSE